MCGLMPPAYEKTYVKRGRIDAADGQGDRRSGDPTNDALHAGVAHRQPAATAPASQKHGKERITMLGRSVMRLGGTLSRRILRIASTRSQLT